MPIIVNLDVMMAKRKISLGELAEKVGITQANLSILKNNKAKAVRFSTLENLCRILACQPQDLLEYEEGETIRRETERDYYESELAVKRSFWNLKSAGCYEHYLVHLLRNDPCYVPELTRVAEADGRIIGLIMYAKAEILTQGKCLPAVYLAILCTAPGYQKKGIAGRMLELTMEQAKTLGYACVFAPGIKDFLREKEFVSTSSLGFKTDAEDTLYVREILPDAIHGKEPAFRMPEIVRTAREDIAGAEEYDRKFPFMEKQYSEKKG